MSNTDTITRSADSRTALWGRIGKVFADENGPRTAADAIREAGLDWDVEKRPLGYHNAKGNFVVAKGHFMTVRTDTDEPLGPVKGRYHVVNNRDVFGVANHIVDDYGALFEAGFESHGGKVVGLTMRLPDEILVGGEDAFNAYLMMRTTHDGSGSIKLAVQTQRMACFNQFDMLLGQAKNRFSIHHTARATNQIAQAREALGITFRYLDAFEEQVQRLMATPVAEKKGKQLLQDVLTSRRFSEDATEAIADSVVINLRHSTTIPDEYRDTAYGWMNSTTEYFEHLRDYRTDQARWLSNTEGPGYRVRNELAGALIAV